MKKNFFKCVPSRNFATIEVICGPMFSGKTEELIRRIKKAEIDCQKVIVFKPEIDNRYNKKKIMSHSRQSFFSLIAENSSEIETFFKKNNNKITVLAIDEVQFFDFNIIKVVEKLVDKNIRVILAGLDQDYLSRPFGPMGKLLAIADIITKQYSICVVCGSAATKTQRLKRKIHKNKEKIKIVIGAAKKYEARCRLCYVRGLDESKSRLLI